MLHRSPSRVTTRAPHRRPGGRLLVFLLVVLVVVLGVVGYVKLVPHLPSADSQPAASSLLAASFFNDYTTFHDQYGTTLPEELSVARVTNRASDCVGGAMPTNKSEYLTTDGLLRARAGWVCLQGPPTEVPDSQCAAPGTNKWRAAQNPRRPPLIRVEHGHLISKSLGGHGDIRDDRGGCMNMTPQTKQANDLLRSRAENRVKNLTASFPETPFSYLSVPGYAGSNYMATGMWVFIVSPGGAEAPGPFLNDTTHITEVGAAS